jgi:hypothetical protein
MSPRYKKSDMGCPIINGLLFGQHLDQRQGRFIGTWRAVMETFRPLPEAKFCEFFSSSMHALEEVYVRACMRTGAIIIHGVIDRMCGCGEVDKTNPSKVLSRQRKAISTPDGRVSARYASVPVSDSS